MFSTIRDHLTPEWTASKNEIKSPRTYIFVGLVASIILPLVYSVPYVADGGTVPLSVSFAMMLIHFVLVPALGLKESTEVLFDGARLSLRIVILGVGLFIIAFWTTPGQTNAFATLPSSASFTLVMAGLYSTLVLGVLWVIQYTRKGTTGIDAEFQ